jgi:predicted nucleic acid-binding protein
MIFVDSNVLIDLSDRVGSWSSWSRVVLRGYRDQLVTSVVVFAEISARFSDLESVRIFLDSLGIALIPPDDRAAFRAGLAFRAYRRAGGERKAILPDFLIAGHASALDATLLTRDRQRFASYFPELKLIAPETDNG